MSLSNLTPIAKETIAGIYTSIVWDSRGWHELGIKAPVGIYANEGSWNITYHDALLDAQLSAYAIAHTFALYQEPEDPQRLADEALARAEFAMREEFPERRMPYLRGKEAALEFPPMGLMPHNRRWANPGIVMQAMRRTFNAQEGKTQRYAKLVADWVFDPADWKRPVRINAYLLDDFEKAWVEAIIIWYHGVIPVVRGQYINSPGYGA